MRLYITGEGTHQPSHVFRPSMSLVEQKMHTSIQDGEARAMFEVALLDGATDTQAYLVALGQDPSGAAEFPLPLGWYECEDEIKDMFF